MKAVKQTKTLYKLELSYDEAVWLKSLMQNFLCCCGDCEETKHHREMRHEYFHTIAGVLEDRLNLELDNTEAGL